MFYYAEIDREYMVLNTHSLTAPSTNANYVPITESQYASGDLVGQYYNSLLGIFEIIDMMNYMGNSNWMTHKETTMPLSTKTDNMEAEIRAKADINHIHDGYASADDLELLEDIINEKANANHSHNEYAPVSHVHSDYATVIALDTLGEEVDSKADANHAHAEYANVSHIHDNYASVSHAHSNYANVTHEHDDYALLNHSHTASEIGAATSGHNHDSDYADINHNHSGVYADFGHNHDSDYASIEHSHNNYATVTALDEVSAIVSGKANSSHNHDNVYYTETEIDALLFGKANSTDLASHANNAVIHVTQNNKNDWDIAKVHADTAHAPANAEVNQNAFSNVVVGNTTISADTKTDTLTLVAGSNVSLTPSAANDSVTISATDTVYTHPTSAGNKHIPAGGSSGQILRWSSDGTAVWGADNDTTYSVATQSANGLMSADDKGKLDRIEEGANNYTLPSAGSALGGVKSGGDVTISSGIITVNDDSHNHIVSNIDGLQSALDSKAASSHGTHVSYSTTAPVMDGTASVGTASTVARSDHKHPVDTSRAAQTSLDSHTANKSNPHGVTLAQLGLTATSTELNYVDGVTSAIQTQLDGKAASSHGTHVSYGTTAPKANGTAAVGTASTVSRSDHVHPLQTTVSGNAGTATKLATARTISLTGDVSGSTSFDGSGNVSITATIADDSHNHTIANIDGLQSAIDVKSDNDHRHYPIQITVTDQDLNNYTDAGFYTFAQSYVPLNAPSGNVNGWLWVIPWTQDSNTIKQVWFRHGTVNSNDFETYVRTKVGTGSWGSWSKYYTTSNPPTADEVGAISKSLQFTDNNGSFKYSYVRDDNKNILTEIASYPIGFYTIYSQSGTSGNPKDTEAWRFMVHKTGSNTGWVQGYGSVGSVYTNYLDGSSGWRGWQCIYDTAPPILWMGEYWCTDTQTVTPSKALSECRNGWVLVWSDYDTANEKSTNGDCFTTVIPKWNPNHVKWSGQSFIAAVPSGLNDSGVVSFAGKRLYVHDTKITGHTVNDVAPSNDVCLRAIYEY